MKLDRNNKYLTIAVYAFLTIVLAAFVIVHFVLRLDLARYLRILTPFFYAFAIAYLLSNIVGLFTRLLEFIVTHTYRRKAPEKIHRRAVKIVAIILTYITFLLLIYLFFSILIPQVRDSVTDFIGNYRSYMAAGSELLNDFVEKHPLIADKLGVERVEESLNELVNRIVSYLTQYSPQFLGWLGRVANQVKNILFGLFISIYMLLGKETFKAQTKKLMAALFSDSTNEKITTIARESDKRFGGFIVGKIIDSVIVGVVCYFCCLIFHFPYPALISFVIGVTNVIPIAGPYIGAIPSTLLILLVDPMKALWFVVFIIVLQQIDGNFLGPKILGESTGLSSFWVLFSLIVMGGLYGVTGMLLAVPLFSVIYYEIKLFAEKRLADKEKDTDTLSYAPPEDAVLIRKPEKKKRALGLAEFLRKLRKK